MLSSALCVNTLILAFMKSTPRSLWTRYLDEGHTVQEIVIWKKVTPGLPEVEHQSAYSSLIVVKRLSVRQLVWSGLLFVQQRQVFDRVFGLTVAALILAHFRRIDFVTSVLQQILRVFRVFLVFTFLKCFGLGD